MKPEYKPLYMQVMESIKLRILSGAYSNTQALPSETALAKEYSVSISTIRQAISVLVAEDFLDKKQGKGTYISSKRNTVKFLTWLTETAKSRQVLDTLITMIEEKYSDITIEIIPTAYVDAKEELQRLIAAGKAPDIAHIVSHWTGYFAAAGAFIDLESVMSEKSLALRSESKDKIGGRFNRKLYSVSWGLCPITLIANMEVLQKYGIKKLPEVLSFEEWDDICQKVFVDSKKEIFAYGLPYDDGEADFLRVYQFMQAFGGEFVSRDGEIVLRSPENIRALQWLQQFCSDGRVLFETVINIRKQFVQDKVAFMHDGPWSKLWLSEMAGDEFDSKFKAVLNPVYTGGISKYEVMSKSWNYNHALAIPTQSVKAALAARVIDAITLDPEISGYYYRSSGHLPVSAAAQTADTVCTDFYQVFSNQQRGSELINAENEFFPKAIDFCIDAVHNIFMKDGDVARELAEKQHYLDILYGY